MTTAAEISKIVAHLTARPRESLADIIQLPTITSAETLCARGNLVLGRLKLVKSILGTKLDTGNADVTAILQALADRDYDRLAELGINTSQAWLDDIVRAALAATPLVEIETIGPYAVHHLTGTGLETRISQLPADEQAGFLLAGIFREVFAGFDNVRNVALVDDFTTNEPSRELTETEQHAFIVAISKIFREFGAIHPADIPGRDYILLRESTLVPQVDELIDRLRASAAGTVGTAANGDVVFHPAADFVEMLALPSANRRREFRKQGILLKRDGRPTCQALDAASFFHPINEMALHVVMLDTLFQSQQDKTYALLRALDIVAQDRHHNVFFDASRLSPETIAYAICEVLTAQTDDYLKRLESASNWNEFDVEEYLTRNYGDQILPEDQRIIDFATRELAALGVPLSGLKMAADIGSGPNLYPAMLLAPYIADDGAIDLIEYGDANRSYVQGAALQVLTEGRHGVWEKFEEKMAAATDGRYRGALCKAAKISNAIFGSIHSLPRNRYDLVSSFFVAESITTSRREFRLAIRSLKSCVKPGGHLLVAHMVGSRQWHAGKDTAFPAVNLTLDEIAQAYRDADLSFTLSMIDEEGPKAREGYHGMAIVVAHHAARHQRPGCTRMRPE